MFGILQGGHLGVRQPEAQAPRVARAVAGGLAGARRALVIWGFLAWENRRLAPGRSALLDPAMLRIPLLQQGLTAFFFQFLLQAGLFFCVPLYLSVALGLSAIDTGLRIMPLSVTLLLAAVGVPQVLPARVAAAGGAARGSSLLSSGSSSLLAALEVGVGPRSSPAAAPRRSGYRRARLAARGGDRLGGARRAERRGGRHPEHLHQPRAPRSVRRSPERC